MLTLLALLLAACPAQVDDFDGTVVSKMLMLVEQHGVGECLKMLDNLAMRTRSKQVRGHSAAQRSAVQQLHRV